MFSKISRYKNLPDLVVVDENGVTRESRALRPLPQVRARFEHILAETDRSDQLAFKYYQQPRSWWRICDANPDFKSPRELFGKAALEVSVFALEYTGESAPWNPLFVALAQRLGVLAVEKHSGQPLTEVLDNVVLFDVPAALAGELTPSVYSQQLTPPLAAALSAGGLTLGTDVSLARVAATRWRLSDRQTGEVFTLVEDTGGGPIEVMDTLVRHSWSITVRANPNNVSPGEIRDQIVGLGFTAGAPQAVTRIGKPVIVPPPTG